MNRRQKCTLAAGSVLCFALLFYLYAFFVEPFWIEVTHHSLKTPLKRGVKIMLLSDLHVKHFGRREKFVLRTAEREQPDVIAVTGDYASNPLNTDAIVELLGQLHARLGVFVVPGNWEYWGAGPDLQKRVAALPNLKLLKNSASAISLDAMIIGLDDRLAGRPDPESAFRPIPETAYRVVLFHSPAEFDHISQKFNLALAGHSHGGQMRIPFFPPLWLPEETRPYIAGWYGEPGRQLYVSRGVGNSVLDARFACRPEIAVFTLEPAG